MPCGKIGREALRRPLADVGRDADRGQIAGDSPRDLGSRGGTRCDKEGRGEPVPRPLLDAELTLHKARLRQ